MKLLKRFKLTRDLLFAEKKLLIYKKMTANLEKQKAELESEILKLTNQKELYYTSFLAICNYTDINGSEEKQDVFWVYSFISDEAYLENNIIRCNVPLTVFAKLNDREIFGFNNPEFGSALKASKNYKDYNATINVHEYIPLKTIIQDIPFLKDQEYLNLQEITAVVNYLERNTDNYNLISLKRQKN